MHDLQIRILNTSKNAIPSYATGGASGMDIRASLEAPIILKPLQRMLVTTGIYFELPPGYEAQVRPRSGIALKQGITCLNSPGTIDCDYRGEIKILLINLSDVEQEIRSGDRIAQIVISKFKKAELILVQQLKDTDRGEGGFGHTGVQ